MLPPGDYFMLNTAAASIK